MNSEKDYELEIRGLTIADDIKAAYKRFGVIVELKMLCIKNRCIVFGVKVKKNSRMKQLLTYAEDVQRRLKLPLFHFEEIKQEIILIVSEYEIKYPDIPAVLNDPTVLKTLTEKELPYIVGYTLMGAPIFVDLEEAPHALLGGASNSGKTIGLQAMIITIVSIKSPSDVRLVLIDIGANGLLPFEGLPHLACPVIKEKTAASYALTAVIEEMERRKGLEYTNPREFRSLPRIMVVIDELPALMRGNDKRTSDFLVNSINSLLERGRHTKIHVVVAAQNPIQRNIKVDLSNATARIAFACAKKNNADTIIEDCGAEKLPGKGAMYFSFPGYGTQRLQGVNVTSKELKKLIMDSLLKSYYTRLDSLFTISESVHAKCGRAETATPISNAYEELYADALYFTLGQEQISAQQLCKQLHIGWPRAAGFIEDFCNWHIVSAADAKLPRRVLPHRLEDVPEELLSRLERYGIPRNKVQTVIDQRSHIHNSLEQ